MAHGRRRAIDQANEAAKLGHPRPRIVPGCTQKQVLGLVAAKNVIDKVGREAHLTAGLALAGVMTLDQPADDRDLPERILEQIALLDPIDELPFQYVGREQRFRVPDGFEPVAGQAIVIGDEAERLELGALHPARDQHAERLVGVPALETVGDHVVLAVMLECLDEELMRLLSSEVIPIEAIGERLSREVAIRVAVPPHGRDTFEALAGLFASHRGDRRVSLELELRGHSRPLRVRADLASQVRIRPSEQLLSEVEKLCGQGSVVLR